MYKDCGKSMFMFNFSVLFCLLWPTYIIFKTKNIKNIVDINISKYFLYISGIRDKLYYFIYLNVVLIKVRITLMLNNYYKNSSESYYCFVKTLTALEQGMNFI